MVLKGLGVLAGTAALIVVGVMGLARLTVPDEPTFSEGLEEAAESGDDSAGFTPSAPGGQLEVTGAAEGTITLEQTAQGPNYGFENNETRIFFTSGPLSIDQMSHEGLAFFPEPEDCEFTEGQHNEDAGLVGVEISCPELVDIRDNGSITLEGVLALPADLVIERDLPDTGGTATVGEDEWELSPDTVLFVPPDLQDDESPSFSVPSDDTDATLIFVFDYDLESEIVTLSRISYRGEQTDVDPGECSSETAEIAAINPDASIHEMTFSCDSVQISSLGDVPIAGTVVYEKIFPEGG